MRTSEIERDGLRNMVLAPGAVLSFGKVIKKLNYKVNQQDNVSF